MVDTAMAWHVLGGITKEGGCYFSPEEKRIK